MTTEYVFEQLVLVGNVGNRGDNATPVPNLSHVVDCGVVPPAPVVRVDGGRMHVDPERGSLLLHHPLAEMLDMEEAKENRFITELEDKSSQVGKMPSCKAYISFLITCKIGVFRLRRTERNY